MSDIIDGNDDIDMGGGDLGGNSELASGKESDEGDVSHGTAQDIEYVVFKHSQSVGCRLTCVLQDARERAGTRGVDQDGARC